MKRVTTGTNIAVNILPFTVKYPYHYIYHCLLSSYYLFPKVFLHALKTSKSGEKLVLNMLEAKVPRLSASVSAKRSFFIPALLLSFLIFS